MSEFSWKNALDNAAGALFRRAVYCGDLHHCTFSVVNFENLLIYFLHFCQSRFVLRHLLHPWRLWATERLDWSVQRFQCAPSWWDRLQHKVALRRLRTPFLRHIWEWSHTALGNFNGNHCLSEDSLELGFADLISLDSSPYIISLTDQLVIDLHSQTQFFLFFYFIPLNVGDNLGMFLGVEISWLVLGGVHRNQWSIVCEHRTDSLLLFCLFTVSIIFKLG